MQFEEELASVLPPDIPHRERLLQKAAQHLQLIHQANEYMNLTRITSPRQAAIKHVLDSVAPWRFFNHATRVLDAGTGAGFPGIPLSVVLPHVQFLLTDSVQKKARFVDAAVDALELPNVHVSAERAEERALVQRPDIITARAVAPLHKLLELFAKSLKLGAELILYKGPEIEAEIAEIEQARTITAEILDRYELPDEMGTRTLVRISVNAQHAGPHKRAQTTRQ